MILAIIINLSIIALIGIAKGINDTLQFHYSDSVFSKLNPLFWNPSVSWKNKYVDADNGNLKPRFLGANTFLVSLTDAWHLFELIRNNLTALLPLSVFYFFGGTEFAWYWYFIAFILLRISYQSGFYIFYRDSKKISS